MGGDQNNNAYGMKAIIIVIISVFLAYFFLNRSNSKQLESNYAYTNAEVVNFNYNNYSYCLEYEFYVNEKKYKNSVCGMSKFYSSEGILGCVGSIFKAKYSRSNPEVSEIDLKGFNKHKPLKP